MRLFGQKELQAALDGGLLKELRILVGALTIAPLVYFALGYNALSQTGEPVLADPVFTVMLCIVAAGELVLAWALPNWKLAKLDFKALAKEGFVVGRGGQPIMEPPKMLGAIIRAHYLFRLALIEAVAIQGLLLAFTSPGAGVVDPRYYWTLAPCVAVPVYFGLVLWPTEERIRAFFDSKIASHPQNQP